MRVPRFTSYLPSGAGLDWVFRRKARGWSKLNAGAAPSAVVVKELWDELSVPDIAAIVDTTEDRELLGWVAQRCDDDLVCRSLLSNPFLPIDCVEALMVKNGAITAFAGDAVLRTRATQEVAQLLVDVPALRTWVETTRSAQRVARILGTGAGAGVRDRFLTEAAGIVTDEHLAELLRGVLSVETAQQQVPVAEILEIVEHRGGLIDWDLISQSAWQPLAVLAAERGTDDDIATILSWTRDPAARAALLAAGRVGVTEALAAMNPALLAATLSRVSELRSLTAGEVRAAAASGVATGIMHNFQIDPQAAAELADDPDRELAGAMIWHVPSDQKLARALASNPAARQWAGRHLWRLGRVWSRLGGRTRQLVFAALPASAILEITSGDIRDWVITDGPAEAVLGLTLRRTEIKTLLDRVRAQPHADLAWKIAAAAERPGERVAAAAIALRSSPAGSVEHDGQLRSWARRSSSGEIVAVWGQIDPELRRGVGKILVDNLRGVDESSWVSRIVGELAINWQQAPDEVQEAAALWLSRQVRDDASTWEAIWVLYPEWEGTLPELLAAARMT